MLLIYSFYVNFLNLVNYVFLHLFGYFLKIENSRSEEVIVW